MLKTGKKQTKFHGHKLWNGHLENLTLTKHIESRIKLRINYLTILNKWMIQQVLQKQKAVGNICNRELRRATS